MSLACSCIERFEPRLLLYSGSILVDVSTDGIHSAVKEYNLTGTVLHTVTVSDNGSDGGGAVLGQYIFVTDQNTGGGTQSGLIRFDSKNSFAATRFASGQDFSDVTIGMDGKLYAMNGGETIQAQVHVFDPLTLKSIRTVNVPGCDPASVVADSSGNIYVGEFDG